MSSLVVSSAAAFVVSTLAQTAAGGLVVLDFEDVQILAGNTYKPGIVGPEYAANGFTLNNTGVVYGPSGIYFVDEGVGYPSTAVYPQYNEVLEVRRSDGGAFSFASVDVTTDPQRKAGSGVLTGIGEDGKPVGTVPFTYSADPSVYTTVSGDFVSEVVAVRISFAGNLDASRGAIDNFTLVPEPSLGLCTVALLGIVTRRRIRA